MCRSEKHPISEYNYESNTTEIHRRCWPQLKISKCKLYVVLSTSFYNVSVSLQVGKTLMKVTFLKSCAFHVFGISCVWNFHCSCILSPQLFIFSIYTCSDGKWSFFLCAYFSKLFFEACRKAMTTVMTPVPFNL